MDETTSFFEHPLDRNLYEPKIFSKGTKEPLRVLITRASSKIAQYLIYGICSGDVFGEDQDVILHMINAKGHHKAIIYELEECGFPCYKDCVVSSEPAVAYKNVDLVLSIVTFEEVPEQEFIIPLLSEVTKTYYVVSHAKQYAKKNCKIVFTGLCTKGLCLILGSLKKLFPTYNFDNVSAVTQTDTLISKAFLGSILKTTTDQIKNVVIWSGTLPDIKNATVLAYPSNDYGAWEKEEIPVADALQNDEWLYKEFKLDYYKKTIDAELIKYGKAVTVATLDHVRALYRGTERLKEVFSMAVITPPDRPYGILPNVGFSYPVEGKNGHWKIVENVPMTTTTQASLFQDIKDIMEWDVAESLKNLASFILLFQETERIPVFVFPDYLSSELLQLKRYCARHFVQYHRHSEHDLPSKQRDREKSVVWIDNSQMKYAFSRDAVSSVSVALKN